MMNLSSIWFKRGKTKFDQYGPGTIAVPSFLVSIWAILLFAITLGWLPVIGAGEEGDLLDQLRHLILPAFAVQLGITETQQFAQFFGGTSLLIMVGVTLDTLKQVESHLLMRHYDGFMKSGRVRGRRV